MIPINPQNISARISKSGSISVCPPKDSFINLSVNQKLSGSVELKQSLGLPGTNGRDGRGILNGEGVPQASLGQNGDFYIDTLTYNLYGPKVGGNWSNFIPLIPQSENYIVTSSANLQSFKIVTTNENGLLIYSNAGNLEHIDQTLGFLFNSPEAGESGIVVTEGELNNPSWNWVPQKAIFLGIEGVPTQIATPSGAVFSLRVGYAKSPTTVVVGLGLPIKISN